jgi:DNA-binding NarL/FixJ family response regulator
VVYQDQPSDQQGSSKREEETLGEKEFRISAFEKAAIRAIMSIPIRVAIVEDEEILRTGLAQRIGSDERFICSDVVGSAEEMLKSTNLSSINVFIIDIGLLGMSGIELIEHLSASDVLGQVLRLTNFDDNEHVRAAGLAGAKGYLLKTTPQARLNNAIEEMHVGRAPLTSIVARILLDYLSNLPKTIGTGHP